MKYATNKSSIIAFLEGREYERLRQQRKANVNHVAACCRALLKNFPEPKMPVDGHGEDDSYNRGYNTALDDLSEIIIEAFGNIHNTKK